MIVRVDLGGRRTSKKNNICIIVRFSFFTIKCFRRAVIQFYRQKTATTNVRNFNDENPPAGRFLPAASKLSSTYRNFFLSTPQIRSDDAVPSPSSSSSPLHAVHFRHSSKFDAFVNFPEPHAVHARFAFCDPARETYVPAEQFAHALHSLSFDSTENFPGTQPAHTRSAWYVPSDATNFPPKQLVHAVHATVDEANVPFSQVVVFVEVDVSAVVVCAPVVDTALLLAAVVVDGLAVVVGAPGATSQTLSEIALPLARMPFVHDVQFQQWLWFDAFANVPSSQELQRRSPTIVPACEINEPGAQIVIAGCMFYR